MQLRAPTNSQRAARTTLLLEGRVLPTLLRLSAPNVLNLLAIAGMITFDGLFLGRLGPDARPFGKDIRFQALLRLLQREGAPMFGWTRSRLSLLLPVFARTRLQRIILVPVFTGLLVLMTAADVLAGVICKPVLTFRNVREIRPADTIIAPWIWKASIVADTRFCATRSGDFEIDFIRIKEYSTDLQFTERLRWSAGQFDVSIELTVDESILEYRIGFVAPCLCRDFPKID